jgi:membrane protease YdiL (CAAX protease family)
MQDYQTGIKPRKRILVAVIVPAVFYLANKAGHLIHFFIVDVTVMDPTLRLLLIYGVQLFICFGVTFLLNLRSENDLLRDLGLKVELFKGLGISFLATLPMLIGFALASPLNKGITAISILKGSVLAGLVEEILFRGFLFGLLFRKVRIGFGPLILLVSIFFGIGHLYQGNDFWSALGVFLITAAGSAMFAWLYVEWNMNLWVPIGMHILMNLYWDLFDIGASNALGGWLPNIFRFATIALAIFLTVRKNRKSGFQLRGKVLKLLY